MEAGVVGGGSWGTAFALHLGRLGIRTKLWVREAEILEELRSTRQNRLFLPGFSFPAEVSFTERITEAVRAADVVFIAVPSQFCRQVYTDMAASLQSGQIAVSLTKGIEEGSLKRMSEVMAEVFPASSARQVAVLSGPSFAREVAERHPTAVVAASIDMDVARTIQRLVSDLSFRIYTSEDVVGVELGGALKNVIALAAGISDALEFGHNPRAALITRGLAEITRLGLVLGANKETFLGLAGLGDLVLTCTARMSRNYHVGFELGQGKTLSQVLSSMKMVAEGVTTTISVRLLSEREGVDMPISGEVYRVLYENKNPQDSLRDLMSRELKGE
jgi:glycerol-3-phosphate dehydrogenase (NAD(P)+)